MQIPLEDRGKYLRGLLIIVKMNEVISEMDRAIIINTAKHFGYATDFYEGILNTLMRNEYIGSEPIMFDSTNLAKYFLIDAEINSALILTFRELEFLTSFFLTEFFTFNHSWISCK